MQHMEHLLLSEQQFDLTINRLCYELIENFDDFENTVIIGIQTSGAYLANTICKQLLLINPDIKLKNGNIVKNKNNNSRFLSQKIKISYAKQYS